MLPVRAAEIVGRRRRCARRVFGIGAGDHLQRQRRVRHRRGKWSNLIERRREGEQAIARNPAVGRLEPDDAAESGRLSNRTAGVGAERERYHPRRDGCGRSAARAAGRAIERPRVLRRTECRILSRRSHRELVAVGLADNHRAGRHEALDGCRGVRRNVVLEDSRACRGCHAASAQVVLERDGHAEERQRRPVVAAAVEFCRAREGSLVRDAAKRVQRRVGAIDLPPACAGKHPRLRSCRSEWR